MKGPVAKVYILKPAKRFETKFVSIGRIEVGILPAIVTHHDTDKITLPKGDGAREAIERELKEDEE